MVHRPLKVIPGLEVEGTINSTDFQSRISPRERAFTIDRSNAQRYQGNSRPGITELNATQENTGQHCCLCGISVWDICVGYLCGISVWDIRVGYPCGISVWDIRVGYLCGISVWDICVGYLCVHQQLSFSGLPATRHYKKPEKCP